MNLKPANLLYNYLQFMQFDMHKAMMNHKLKQVSPILTGHWLDIGAGDQPYKKYFSQSEAYETTNTRRHYTTTDFEQLKDQTTYWIEDGKALPLPDQTMDGVACFQVLSVIDKPEDFFKEISRVLKPGGKLVLTTDFLYPVWSKEDRFRHTAFSLQSLACESGFDEAETESFGSFGSAVYALFMRYMRSFPEIWKRKSALAKSLSLIPYLLLLLLLPIISLKGCIIFLLEKNNRQSTAFTFNILLVARKKRSL
ncbi:MAG: class I SAM-dependent methyltransferase [Bacteroidota bacterium]